MSDDAQPPDAKRYFKDWLKLATQPTVIRRALVYAVVVGAILINHSDALMRGDISGPRLWRIGLAVRVPYLVSTLSSVGAMRAGQTRD